MKWVAPSIDIDEVSDTADDAADDADDGKATSARERTVQALKREGKTLGAWLAARGTHERNRGEPSTRDIVEDEFDMMRMRSSRGHSVSPFETPSSSNALSSADWKRLARACSFPARASAGLGLEPR